MTTQGLPQGLYGKWVRNSFGVEDYLAIHIIKKHGIPTHVEIRDTGTNITLAHGTWQKLFRDLGIIDSPETRLAYMQRVTGEINLEADPHGIQADAAWSYGGYNILDAISVQRDHHGAQIPLFTSNDRARTSIENIIHQGHVPIGRRYALQPFTERHMSLLDRWHEADVANTHEIRRFVRLPYNDIVLEFLESLGFKIDEIPVFDEVAAAERRNRAIREIDNRLEFIAPLLDDSLPVISMHGQRIILFREVQDAECFRQVFADVDQEKIAALPKIQLYIVGAASTAERGSYATCRPYYPGTNRQESVLHRLKSPESGQTLLIYNGEIESRNLAAGVPVNHHVWNLWNMLDKNGPFPSLMPSADLQAETLPSMQGPYQAITSGQRR